MKISKPELFLAFNFISFVLLSSISSAIIGAKVGIIISLFVLIFLAIFFNYPRSGLWIFLTYLPFAGTVTYAFESAYAAVGGYVVHNSYYFILHLVKDCFYFPALGAILINTKYFNNLQKQYKWIFYSLFALFITCSLTLIVVNFWQKLNYQYQENLFLIGLLGLKVLLGYIPLIICAYYLIRTKKDLLVLNRLNTILILVCCGLCLLQYLLLIYGICPGNTNLVEPAAFRPSLQARCLVGGSLLYNPQFGFIRLPGTFVAPWQWGWFLIANSFLAVGSYVSESRRIWRWLSLASMGLILIATVISGQRVAFFLVPMIFILLFLMQVKNYRFRRLKIAGMIALILLIANLGPVQTAWDNFIARWEYSPPPQFVWRQWQWLINAEPGLLGKGLGTTASAARHLGEINLVEVFPARLAYEIGWLGLLIFLITVSVICVATFKVYRNLQSQKYRRLALCLWLFIVLISYNLWYYPLVVDPVAVYYWFYVGLILRLPKLDYQITG